MSGDQFGPPAASDFVQSLNRVLALQHVLQIGDRLESVAQVLRVEGIEVSSVKTPRDPISSHYDLVLCGGLDSLPAAEVAAFARKVADRSDAVLCNGDSNNASTAPWLHAFCDLGFAVEPVAYSNSSSRMPVLLRRRHDVSSPNDELIRLRREIVGLRSALADLREEASTTTERLESRIAQLQSRMNQTTHEVRSILNSRIWRMLVSAAGWLLRAGSLFRREPADGRRRLSDTDRDAEGVFRMMCDEPAGSMARTGIVKVRGWAVASSGILRVEIQPCGKDVIPARFGIYRPDIAIHIPGMPDGDRCGFQASLDSTCLDNGRQEIIVRAISRDGNSQELRVPILLDHVHGFVSDYHRWIAEFEKRDLSLIQLRLDSFPIQPRISILVPVYRTAPDILRKTIDSVLAQSYSNWELCLADDFSKSGPIDEIFAEYAKADPRVKTVHLEQNGGISAASNSALKMATGEYVALLDHDDQLAVDALFHVVDTINREPDAEIFYSDEDHIDESGFRTDPFFKPDWSPDLILSENYVTHLMVFQTRLAREVGGFRSECDLSQDHDILLRMSLRARKITHIPRILYHWRTNVFTIDRASNQESRALATSRHAIEDYLKLAGKTATVEPGLVSGRWRVRYDLPKDLQVDIIMPCGGKVDLLERCVGSIADRTEYPFYRLTVVDNSRNDAVGKFVRTWSKHGRKANYVDWRNRPFNYSAMNNDAAKTCTAPMLLFLNDDITVLNPGWLTAMVELAARAEIGPVGAKLLYPDGSIQHAGVTIGLFGVCGHGFKGTFDDQRSYFDFPDVIRNVSAVTAACMMLRTKLFWEVGGFDQEHFPVAYNDVDICLKLVEKGYRVLYTPHAKLYHYEAISKRAEDRDPRPEETKAFQAKWGRYIQDDPFYSPHLTRSEEDYTLRKLTEKQRL